MRPLRYLNGRTPSPVPAEARHWAYNAPKELNISDWPGFLGFVGSCRHSRFGNCHNHTLHSKPYSPINAAVTGKVGTSFHGKCNYLLAALDSTTNTNGRLSPLRNPC